MTVKRLEVPMKDTHETRIALLEQSQLFIFQALERIEKKLDHIEENFDKKIDGINVRIDAVNARIDTHIKWLVGTLLGSALSLVAVVVNIALRFHS